MKPSDLKSPFTWSTRTVTFDDRILYVPPHCSSYDTFVFPAWSDPLLFGNHHPIHIEYCSGNGSWIADKAASNPMINWVAVEMQFKRIRKIWSKIKNLHLNNLILICGEAHMATRLYLPSDSFEQAYINFPDPWPKNRHAKHRLIHSEFIKEVRRVLKPSGDFTLVTDDPDYSERMMKELKNHPNFENCYPHQGYATERSGYGTSYFEQLWREQGKTIRFHQYRKAAG